MSHTHKYVYFGDHLLLPDWDEQSSMLHFAYYCPRLKPAALNDGLSVFVNAWEQWRTYLAKPDLIIRGLSRWFESVSQRHKASHWPVTPWLKGVRPGGSEDSRATQAGQGLSNYNAAIEICHWHRWIRIEVYTISYILLKSGIWKSIILFLICRKFGLQSP